MQAAVWGPAGWTFLHSVAHGFPDDPAGFDRENGLPVGTTSSRYQQFFMLVGSVLPCRYCRDSYLLYVSESPPRTCSRSTLTKWLWEIHNKVNTKLGAKYKGADFPSACARYESYRAKCSDPTSLGCTVPEGNNTRKKARVVIEEVSPSVSGTNAALLGLAAVVGTLLAVTFLRRSA